MPNTNHTYPNQILVRWKTVLWKVTVSGAICAIMGCSPPQTPTTQASPTSQETITTRKNTPRDSSDSRASQSPSSRPKVSSAAANTPSQPTDTTEETLSSISSATKRSSTSTVASRTDGEFAAKRSGSTTDAPLRQTHEQADTVVANENTANGRSETETMEQTNPAEENRKILLTELEASLEIAERKAMRESDYGGAYRLLVTTFAKFQTAQNEQKKQERLGMVTKFSPELQAREATFERRLKERLQGYADRANEIAKRQMDLKSDQTPLVMQGS